MRHILRLATENSAADKVDVIEHDHSEHVDAVEAVIADIGSDDDRVGELLDMQDGVQEGRLVLESLGLDLSSLLSTPNGTDVKMVRMANESIADGVMSYGSKIFESIKKLIAKIISWISGSEGKSNLIKKTEATNATIVSIGKPVEAAVKATGSNEPDWQKVIAELKNSADIVTKFEHFVEGLSDKEKAWIYDTDDKSKSGIHAYYDAITRADALSAGPLNKAIKLMEDSLTGHSDSASNLFMGTAENTLNSAGMISGDCLRRPIPAFSKGDLHECFVYLQNQAKFLQSKNIHFDQGYLKTLQSMLEKWGNEIKHVDFNSEKEEDKRLLQVRGAQVKAVADYIKLVEEVASVTLAFKSVFKKTLMFLKTTASSMKWNDVKPDNIDGMLSEIDSILKDMD